MNVHWQDLETKGFVVVREFLGDDQLRAMLDDYRGGPPPEDYPFCFKLIGRRALNSVRPLIQRSLDEIQSVTSLRSDTLNFLTLSHYITTKYAERSSFFHQDFDLEYRLTGDHFHYLNFWIPVMKPDQLLSNVGVIPLDSLRSRSEEAFARLEGSGGRRLIPVDGRTAVFGNSGEVLNEGDFGEPEFWIDFDVSEVEVVPALKAGDLLLLRGDVVHRTQDTDTTRVAASIRVTGSDKKITRERAGVDKSAESGPDPAAGIKALLAKCFESLGRSEVTVSEFVRFAQNGRQ